MRRALTRILAALVLFLLAAGGGYLLSARFGQEILRIEAQRQLAKLMRGPVTVEQIRLKLRLGIEIEADNLAVYPGPDGPSLSARHASARVDLLSLLLGRPRLGRLTLDRAHMRIEHLRGGSWSPPPLAKLSERGREQRAKAAGKGEFEPRLAILLGMEKVTRVLMERALIANRVELRHGSVTFIDAEEQRGDGRPLELQLKHIEGTLDHRWLSGQADLHLSAVFEDDHHRSTQVEAEGRRLPDGALRLSLAATGLELAVFDPYLARTGRPISVTGKLSGSLAFETAGPDHGSLEFDWSLHDVATALTTGRGQMQIESPLSQLRAHLAFSPDQLRLARAQLAGTQLTLDLSGVVERPLRSSSLARFSADLRGTGLDEVRHIVDSLPQNDRESLTELLQPVEAVRIEHVGGSGSADVSRWQKLLAGDLSNLPESFLLTAELADLAVATESGGGLSNGGASAEWSSDRIEIRDGHGLWKGKALPELALTIEGVSKLIAASRSERTLASGAEPLPGIYALRDLLRGDPDEAETRVAPSIQIAIHQLHHPALGQPLEHALVAVDSIPRGLQMSISEGSWGGAPIRGEAIYLRQPESALHMTLQVDSPQQGSALEGQGESVNPGDGKWATGRFQVTPAGPDQLPFSVLFGGFELTHATLSLSKLRVDLGPEGFLEADGSLELDKPEEVPIEMTLRLEEGDLAAISEELGLPPKRLSGRLSLQARLSGRLRAGEPLLAGLTGDVSLSAHNGNIGKEAPLLVALTQATEGLNPFANRDSIHFESMEATLELDRGRVLTDDFELEGPVRMRLSGWADYGRPSREIEGILGVFLFRRWDQILGSLPVVKSFIPGSDKGLVGAYFEVSGKLGEPKLTSLPVKSLTEELPDILTTPLKAIRSLLMTKRPKTKRWDGPRPGLPESQ